MTDHGPIPWIVFDRLPDPILLLDANRNIVSANQAARDLFGPDIEGADMVVALRHPEAISVAAKALGGDDPEPREITIFGEVTQIFEVRAGPIAGDGEAQAVITLHNTTSEKRAEGMRVDFVANVSHELRSPLSSLLGFVETLRGPAKEDVEAHEKFLGIMQNEAERMARIIEDLLSLSQVETNEHIQPQSNLDLALLLGQVVDVVQSRAETRGMRISLEGLDALPKVVGDNDQLFQVFQNLIDNAIKYGFEDTEVIIDAAEVEYLSSAGCAGIAVSVSDKGIGIPNEDLLRLTERFYRVDKARSRKLGGTGLGLAIVKHIVSRHRGTLTIDSEEGKGSTFTVTLPISRPASVTEV